MLRPHHLWVTTSAGVARYIDKEQTEVKMAKITIDKIRNDVTISEGLIRLRLDNHNIIIQEADELKEWLLENYIKKQSYVPVIKDECNMCLRFADKSCAGTDYWRTQEHYYCIKDWKLFKEFNLNTRFKHDEKDALTVVGVTIPVLNCLRII